MAGATLIDVAKRAEVSKSTVSLVVNGSDLVHPATAERVWQAVAELNYVPNRSARVLQSGRSQLIGIIVSDITNPYFAELVRSVLAYAKAEGFDGFVFDTDYDPTQLMQHIDHALQYRPDGLLLLTTERSEQAVARLEELRLPAVLLNWGVSRNRVAEVAVDYEAGMAQLVEHLIALGHRRLAFVGGPVEYHSAHAREEAFQRVVERSGEQVARPTYLRGEFRLLPETGSQIVEQIAALEERVRPTAIVASSDQIALSILRALLAAGWRVPEQISLAGIDDIAFAAYVTPALTTLRLPRRSMGKAAFDLLKQMIDDSEATPLPYTAQPRLILRESLGRAP